MPRKNTFKSKPRDDDERASRTPASIKLAAGFMLVLAIGGAAGVRYLKTPAGAVYLVDHGAVAAYTRVQRDASRTLRHALETFGLRSNIRVVGDNAETVQHDLSPSPRQPMVWDIPCADSTDLLKVNVTLTEAVQSAGLVVRRSEEFDQGHRLVFHIGTHTLDTHRVTLRRVSPEAIASVIPPVEKRPRLALVIDDFGYAKGGIPREVLDLDIPLTISILPSLRYSRDVFTLARAKHRCILLHLPMEGTETDRIDADPVSSRMSDEEIATLVRSYVESLPGVDGVNNHQGSLATTDPRVMKAVMGVLAGRGVFFLDSLTSPKSLAYNAAIEAGLRAAQNSMFIDDATERRDDITARLHTLVELARSRGTAIGIGHPHPWTFEALQENLEYLESAGVELVTVCELMDSTR